MSKPHAWYDPDTDPEDLSEDVAGADGADAIEASAETAELIQRMQAERDEAVDARKRALADFENFRRRASDFESRALERGAASVIKALIPALDHLDLALNQNLDRVSVEQLAHGIKLVREELFKSLQGLGVQLIVPEVGTPFDPHRHDVVMQRPAPGVAPESVVEVLQPGYAKGDMVLRPAKIAVAPPESTEAEGG